MRKRRFVWLSVAVALACAAGSVRAQVTEIGGVGNIFEKRKAAKSTPANAKASPTPQANTKATPAAQANRPTPAQPGQQPQQAAQPGRGPQQGAPATLQRARAGATPAAGASAGPAGSGQVRLVTRALAESVKTQKVDYDPNDFVSSQTVLILNPRRYRPENTNTEPEKRTPRDDSGPAPIARPL
ncbi:MAG: hypothetical protein D6691_10500 [Candidatus Hydrogenedentota bacterium]|uniref:Uncharacterized protein n=1 Tax=Sumerlaea chitinivorans TaxID=2250252 RepID=A0A2Z4Y1E2_SUMC1|nr:hypothetical protein BRCON_0002 [Candidatus Sumerlaea chitinivorans]MCX7963198.1 hypothetical protein [Candidatus Sumerlaea chitinivorans]RMH25031.1 MAG: hypothetical protein D6691_10500 [Candidatus Hydrogenedentota bacterium]GIX44726.1 MAG: hypothetical protein KatS3mg130_1134 [Candidatus Sumerlaea sp.]